MPASPDAETQLGNSLHYHPDSYWCPTCREFTLGCSHLVAPLGRKRVAVKDWLIVSVGYDRKRRILELEMNNRDVFQHYDMPLAMAVALVRAKSAGKFFEERISGKFRFERVRTR